MSAHQHLRPHVAADAPAVLDLYQRAFGVTMALSRWRWQYLSVPGSNLAHTVGCWVDDRLVGTLSTVPQIWMLEGRALAGARLQDACVAPEARGQGVFTRLLHQLRRQHDDLGLDLVIAFPNQNSLPACQAIGHYRTLPKVERWRLDRPAPAPASAPSCGLRTELQQPPHFDGSDVACFAKELRGYRLYQHRSADYLSWRYGPQAPKSYTAIRAFDGEKQVGLAVAKHYPAGRTIDFLELCCGNDAAILGVLLSAAAATSTAGDGTALELWAHKSYGLAPLLSHAGFASVEPSTAMIARSPAGLATAGWSAPTGCYLSMGDSDVY